MKRKDIPNKLTYEFLYQEHVIQKKPIKIISEETGLSHITIDKYLRKFNLKLRAGNSKEEMDSLIGRRCGLLTIKKFLGRVKPTDTYYSYLCNCDCGNTKIQFSYILRNEYVQSCGCLNKKKGSESHAWKGSKYLSGSFLKMVKYSAKDRNLEFDLTNEYLDALLEKQEFKCKLSNLPIRDLRYSKDHNLSEQSTLSLDRIDSSKGYIQGNVQFLHKEVNYMKMDLDQKRFLELCKLISNVSNGVNNG